MKKFENQLTKESRCVIISLTGKKPSVRQCIMLRRVEKTKNNQVMINNGLIIIDIQGSIAQLGEHLPYKQRVIGSIPIVPTKDYTSKVWFLAFGRDPIWPGSSVG